MILAARWLIPITSPAIYEGALKISNGKIIDIGYAKEI